MVSIGDPVLSSAMAADSTAFQPETKILTSEQMLALVESALARGEMEYVVYHGVGGDWLVTPMEMFTALLDKLEASRDRIRITDPISWHQYVTERKTASVKILSAGKTGIELALASAADPTFYDLPLSLETTVPEDWTQCRVKQGTAEVTVPVKEGKISYSAIPGEVPVEIEPVPGR